MYWYITRAFTLNPFRRLNFLLIYSGIGVNFLPGNDLWEITLNLNTLQAGNLDILSSSGDEIMLKWDSSYDLGHERIDAEHRIFFGLIVDFQEAISNLVPTEKLLRMLNIIIKYAEFHFLNEEEIMTEHQYPEQTQHAHLHIILLDEIKNILAQFKQDKLETSAVSEFLLKWFLLHISRQDKKLVGFIGKTS